VTTRAYDNLNRLSSISSVASGQSVLSLRVSFGFQYNCANQRTRMSSADETLQGRNMRRPEPPRSCQRAGQAIAVGSAPVLGRINPTTDVTPVSITQIRHPNLYRSVAAKNGRARAPAKAPTQRGGSPRQAERSPACNRRLLRRGNTRWRAAGGEPPVRNNVTWIT